MTVIALGLNHHSAPLDLRGRFAVPGEQLGQRLRQLRERLGGAAQTGLALLSTCNRTELYLGGSAAAQLQGPAEDWLAELGGSTADWQAHRYQLADTQVARHAFRVAAGLDSAMLGETQILGQLKQAVRLAGAAGQLDPTLQQLFQRSFQVAKQVRTSTEVGMHAVSLASLVIELAHQLFGELSQQSVLFVGAGEMIEGLAPPLLARAPKRAAIAHRGAERAQRLAHQLGTESLPLAGLDARLSEFDIIVSCTASSLPLIGLGAVQRALKARKRRPVLIIDLAVPRDVEPEVGALDDVFLYSLDALTQRLQQGGARRQAAVVQAEALVEAGVQGFSDWLTQRRQLPLLHQLQTHAAGAREQVLQRAQRQLARGEAPEQVMAQLADALSAKLLHGALAGLHHGADPEAWQAAVRRCFLDAGRR